jgi:hypothetical protein
MDEFAVLAHRLYREAHFFFFFLFFLMISAWVLKACASVLIWLATYVSAVFTATRSAVAACCRIAFGPSSYGGNFLIFAWFPLQREAVAFAASVFRLSLPPDQRASYPSDQ